MSAKKYLLTFGLIASSVISTYFVTVSTVAQQAAQKETADTEYQVGAVLFMQKSAEYRALCYQAFNWAQMSLDMDDKTKKKLPKIERKKPRAVVVDIDETVLDNSPAQAVQVKNRLPFIQSNWTNWVLLSKAKAIPGAVDFLKYAASKGVRVFYISNRIEIEKQATMDNLKTLGFPDVSAETVLVKTGESSKKIRRGAVTDKHRIVLLLGDNLDDFSEIFERKPIADRFLEVDTARARWGKQFIVLPNAMYGTWENAIYGYERLTEAQKTERRADALETY